MNRQAELTRLRDALERIECESSYLKKLGSYCGVLDEQVLNGILHRHQRALDDAIADARTASSTLDHIAAALRQRAQKLSFAGSNATAHLEELSLRAAIGEFDARTYERLKTEIDIAECHAKARQVTLNSELESIRSTLDLWRKIARSHRLHRPGLAEPEPSPDELAGLLNEPNMDNLLLFPEPKPVRPMPDDPFGLEELIPFTDDLELLVASAAPPDGLQLELRRIQERLDAGDFATAERALVALRNERMDDPLVLALLAQARLQNRDLPLELRVRDASSIHQLASALDLGDPQVQEVLSRVRHLLAAVGVAPSALTC